MIAHGAFDHAELTALGIDPTSLIDFSSNLNPFGPPAAVRTALATLDPAAYPDRSCHQLRNILATHHACTPNEILPGNGANELIHLIARALLKPGDHALIIGPTYGEYAYASQLAGASVVEWRAAADADFALDLTAIMAQMSAIRPRLTWICLPNNPTGIDLPTPAIHELAQHCAAHNGLLVLDRAYHRFRRDLSCQEVGLPNSIQLHSLTKSYAIAGLRLGYLVTEAQLIARIAAFQPTWSVSSAALAAGSAALSAETFLPSTMPQLWQSSDTLLAGLIALGLHVHRATTPFMLVRSGDATATRSALLQHGCAVRDGTSFGLPAWVRISPRQVHENRTLLTAWKALL